MAGYAPKETTYNGRLFRSRLEARWAAFFDLCEFRWEYEPVQLKGYIPDFILQTESPTLVEVKPLNTWVEVQDIDLEKVCESGWQQEILLVGATLFPPIVSGIPVMGMLGNPVVRDWAEAATFKCSGCGKISFASGTQSYHCRRCGANDGGNHWQGAEKEITQHWRAAGNTVRWLPNS